VAHFLRSDPGAKLRRGDAIGSIDGRSGTRSGSDAFCIWKVSEAPMASTKRNGRSLRRKPMRPRRKTMSLRREAEDIGHWVEKQAGTVGEAVKRRPSLMFGAMSAAAAGLLGWYLGRH
jgi:hypothetical protein